MPLKSAPGWVMLGWWMPCWEEQHRGTEGMELRAPCPWECCHWYGGTGPCWDLAVPSALVSQGMLRLSWKALVKVPKKSNFYIPLEILSQLHKGLFFFPSFSPPKKAKERRKIQETADRATFSTSSPFITLKTKACGCLSLHLNARIYFFYYFFFL